MAVATIPTSNTHIRSGKIKALAIGAAKRAPSLPDVPTTVEAGLPSYQAEIWWAWATTAGTPEAVLNKLNNEIAAILVMPETAKRFAVDSAEVDIEDTRRNAQADSGRPSEVGESRARMRGCRSSDPGA